MVSLDKSSLCRYKDLGKFYQALITQGKYKGNDQESPGGGEGSALLLLIQVITTKNVI